MSEMEGEGFVIKDKRSSQRSDEDSPAEEAQGQPEESAEPTSEKPAEGGLQIDFSTFILSLTSSAFLHLGDMADPTTSKKETNLPAVEQTIDILRLMKEKTQGNLTEDEYKLIEQLIYELQMKFLAKSKEPSA